MQSSLRNTLIPAQQLSGCEATDGGQVMVDLLDLGVALFENSPDCIKILDREGRLLSINGPGRQAMEIERFDTLYGEPWISLWPTESHPAICAALETARNGKTGHFSAYCTTTKGKPKWWDVVISPVRDHTQHIGWLVGVSREITDWYQTSKKLQDTVSRLQFSMQATHLGQWELDLGTGYINGSVRYSQCFGYEAPPAEWNLAQFIAHIHPDDRHRVMASQDDALAHGHNYSSECRVIWPDRSVHWIQLHGHVEVKDGKAIRLFGIVEDITLQKRADLLMQGQKKAFELAIQGAALPQILDVLASTAEAQAGGALCASILLLDKDGRRLRHAAASSLPHAYTQAIDGIVIGPCVGSCGTAAFSQQVVVVRDIQADPLWEDYRDLARAHNLQACWSTPILSAGGKLHGTFAFYYQEVRDPTPEEREAMVLLVNTAALVLDLQREMQQRQDAAEALQDARTRLEATLAAAEVATWTLDLPESRLHGDHNMARFYAGPGQACLDISLQDLLKTIYPDDLPGFTQALRKAVEEGEPFEVRYRTQAQDKYCALVMRGRVQYDASGAPAKLLGIALDVTGQSVVEAALHKSEERYRTLFEMMDQGFCLIELLYDASGKPHDYRFVETNPAFVTQTGITDCIGKTVLELFPDIDPSWIEIYAKVAITGTPVHIEYEAKVVGSWFDVYASKVGDEESNLVALLFTNITERKRTEQEVGQFNAQLERQANYDTLTGIPNRRLFRDRLEQELRHAQAEQRQVALLILDLDHFKEVNDLLGHDAGDQLLVQAARRIEQCLAQTDSLARLGGDEFAVILTDSNDVVSYAGEVAQRIRQDLAQPFMILHERVEISCSIGITIYPHDAAWPEDLIRNADQAMYRAKATGRSQLAFFTQSMQAEAMQRLKLIAELRHAVAEKQLELYFQPVVDLTTGHLTKAEALVRWHHPLHGVLGPAHFIGIAEETGLIHEIGDWVFEQAVIQSMHWTHLLSRPFPISVNVSPLQLLMNEDVKTWLAQLDASEIAPHSIVVEITENILLHMSETVSDKVRRLRRAGVDFSIDDFGTGYSSLAYLKRLDFDYLKIDRSFVRDMLQDATPATIVETIILMAHKLGLKVVAEGVETAQQRDWLMARGCDYAQGYLFSEPIPADEFERLLRNDSGLYKA